MWRNKNLGSDLTIEVNGTAPVTLGDAEAARTLRGPLAAVVRWAAGRGAVGVTSNGPVPAPPRWL